MRVVGCMATYDKRKDTRHKAIDSIESQLDELMVFNNSERNKNSADNAKFLGLDIIKDPVYYLTLDDDLIYPQDYVEKTIEAIETYECIITHHGRRLRGLDLNYYSDHDIYQCLGDVEEGLELDVAGTGVTAFRTDYFHPKGLADCPLLRMSDILFSLEAARQDKKIGIIPHKAGWIKHIPNPETIYQTEKAKGCAIQNHLANEIFTIRNSG